MRLKTTVVSLTAAAAMLATPAFAAQPTTPHGKSATSPAHICTVLKMSHKKTNHGKGQSPFAACVSGVKRAQAEAAKSPSAKSNPATLCKTMSHKKSATDKKSPFAACVSGAAKAQHLS
ncbi:MAG: hypothetical protein QOE11_1581 [Solirubrobacteraceae bacterium]|jgi:hypothetical protein|nr:hypothetical protein [Solirubrobacteraceae bacterium]